MVLRLRGGAPQIKEEKAAEDLISRYNPPLGSKRGKGDLPQFPALDGAEESFDDCSSDEEQNDYGEGGYGEGGYGEEDDEDCYNGNNQSSRQGSLKYVELQNFLKYPSLTFYNLTPVDSCVSLETDLKRYSHLTVLAYDSDSVAQRVIDLPWDTPLATRDLSLQDPLDSEKAFTESRTFLTLRAETCDQHLIKDINSTQMQVVGDLKRVKAIFDSIRQE